MSSRARGHMGATGGERFTAFMLGRWPGLLRLALGLTTDPGLAAEVAQATLASACASWGQLRRADDPDAYLRRVLVRTGNRRLRRLTAGTGAAAAHAPQGHEVASATQAGMAGARTGPTDHPDPPERTGGTDQPAPFHQPPPAGQGESTQRPAPPVLPALAELPPRQRAVLVLRCWEDLSDAQVAAALRCTRATVRAEAARGLAALQRAGVLGSGDDP